MNKKINLLVSIILLQTGLTGCAAMLPLSIATTTMIISDERSIGNIIDDKMIASKINSELSKHGNAHIFLSIHINVLEGRVLLTGSVASQQCSDEAVKIAWSTHGVREVINEIVIELKNIKNTANDTWIENTINSRLLLEKKFLSVNYKVSVNNGIVFLLGIAQNKEEMDKALYIASHTKGIQKVVNYIILKNDPLLVLF